jgi:hypothetical protein
MSERLQSTGYNTILLANSRTASRGCRSAAFSPLSGGSAPNRSRLKSALRHAPGTGSEFANSINPSALRQARGELLLFLSAQ